jgi:hypothetical protein
VQDAAYRLWSVYLARRSVNKGPRNTNKGVSINAPGPEGRWPMALSPGRLSLGYPARAVTPTAADGLDNLFAVIAYGA